jgi:methionine-rich copper-binding protein CopC
MKTNIESFRLLAIALVVLSFIAPSSWAHARLTRSVPENKATLPQSPQKIELWFNELLEEGAFNTLQVFPARELKEKKHTNLAKEPLVDKQDKTHLIVTLPELPAGDYVAEWRVLSRDGHSAPGRITFHISSAK